MKRQCLQKRFFSGLVFLCISLSFFISAYADPFTGAYLYTGVDPVTGYPIVEVRGVNPTNETFTGQNVIEMNAYNNAPVLTSNTFNGSTSIDPAFTDITSNGNTYNGTTTITYDGVTGGNLESNNDTFATANVNTSNADVEINNPTFNGTTNLQAQNVSLGSISQMDQLLDGLYTIYVNFLNINLGSNTLTRTSWTGNSVSIDLYPNAYYSVSYDSSNNTFSISQKSVLSQAGNPVYGTFSARLYQSTRGISESLKALGDFFTDLYSYIKGVGNYRIYEMTVNGEYYTITSSTQSVDFRVALNNRLEIILRILNYYAGRFYQWYYPLDASAPYYWRYYNTDTEVQESIGLAGLWYNISWYLGEIYQNLTDAGSDMTSDAQQLGSSISALNTAEESVNTQIQSAFSTVSGLMTLPVISSAALCISWIEYMWGSLGIFQSPTLLAYMCVILMMLIGFAKYRSAFR